MTVFIYYRRDDVEGEARASRAGAKSQAPVKRRSPRKG
jgi:hypothetical protein